MHDWREDLKKLRKVNKMSMPNNVLILDIETTYTEKDNVQFHTFKMGWTVLVYRETGGRVIYENWRFWKDPTLLWKYVENSVRDKQSLYVFGNNIYFDLQAGGFFKYMANHGWQLDFIYDNGLTYILVIHHSKRNMKLLSLTNYFEASVKELGELLGKQKIGIDFDTIDDETLQIYCFRDVEICLDMVMIYFSFLETNDLGDFSLSRASQSLKAFRHRFMIESIYVHENSSIFELERGAYYGGRTECFRIGVQSGGPFVCYDINSLYPFVMRSHDMPIKPLDYQSGGSVSEVSKILDTYGIIARVSINTECPRYAVRIKNKVIFPIGRFDTFLCSGALRTAIEHGEIESVKEYTVYQMANIFQEYVDFFYAIRRRAKETNNRVWDMFAKRFMNSLYGKFGQQVPYTISKKDAPKGEYSREEIIDAESGENWIVTRILGKEIVEYGKHATNTTIMAIPAHVTEYARILLWGIIESVGIDKVLYCDTDSLWIRKRDAHRIRYPISDFGIGDLKLEQTSERFEVYCPKDYVTDTTTKIKGIPKKAVKLSENDYEYWTFQRQRSHLIKGVSAGYRVKKVRKHITRKYDKGHVNADGSVSPFRFVDNLPSPAALEFEAPTNEED
jgi:hypothetical protein